MRQVGILVRPFVPRLPNRPSGCRNAHRVVQSLLLSRRCGAPGTRVPGVTAMPLTSAKLTHIKSRIAQAFAGRSQMVSLTCRNGDGSTRPVLVNGVFKPQYD